MGHREPSNAEHIGVLREVDAPAWPPKNEPLGAVVSADVPSVSPVASAIHTARQVRLRLEGSKGSSRLSQDPQDPQGQALAVATSATGCSCCFATTTSATGVAVSATASGCRDCLAARSSSKRLSCLAFLAAAPARPAATFLGSFDLAVGEAATGTGAGVVILSNPSVDSVWVFTQALCAGVVWSASIFWRDVGIIHIMRTMFKSAVPQCG